MITHLWHHMAQHDVFKTRILSLFFLTVRVTICCICFFSSLAKLIQTEGRKLKFVFMVLYNSINSKEWPHSQRTAESQINGVNISGLVWVHHVYAEAS